ncbi:Unannotated, partial [Lentimonas sp. CC19]
MSVCVCVVTPLAAVLRQSEPSHQQTKSQHTAYTRKRDHHKLPLSPSNAEN